MEKKFFRLFLLLFSFSMFAIVAQENEITPGLKEFNRTDVEGYWILEKAVLVQQPLYNPEQKKEENFSFSQLADISMDGQHFLLKTVIMSCQIFDETDPASYVKFPGLLLNDPTVETNNYPELFIADKKDNNMFINYVVQEFSDTQMILSSGEIFYNEGRVPMQAELVITLNKQ